MKEESLVEFVDCLILKLRNEDPGYGSWVDLWNEQIGTNDEKTDVKGPQSSLTSRDTFDDD